MGNAYHGKNGAHGFQASVRSASYPTKSARSGEANSCCPRWGAALAAEFESRAKAKAKASEKVS